MCAPRSFDISGNEIGVSSSCRCHMVGQLGFRSNRREFAHAQAASSRQGGG